VLDRNGEYQRLGESQVRRADLRVVAATSREMAELKHDFAARFTLQLEIPPLAARTADVPLLVRRLLQSCHLVEARTVTSRFRRRTRR